MWTGEQVVEAVMTNAVVRVVEVLAAPAFIWWNASKFNKQWPKPILIGFILIVTAACFFLEERFTDWIKYHTYDEQRFIREWLDEIHHPSELRTGKDDIFRFVVTGETQFEIYRKVSRPGVITISAGIIFKPETIERIKRLSFTERKLLQNDIYLELSRHKYFLPIVELKESEIFNLMGMESDFEFPIGSSRYTLNEQLTKVRNMRQVVDLVFHSWKSQGRL